MYQRKIPKEFYCTVDYALDIFGGKWKPRLLCIIANDEPIRYQKLKEQMENISDTALADSLKELQNAGIVNRHQFNEMPLRVEYSLTSKGETLIPVLNKISAWAIQNSSSNIYQGKHFRQIHQKAFQTKKNGD